MLESFYDLKSVSFKDRESFNNTILLLTLVKKEAFYMVGFSRPRGIIKIGFDFESDLHDSITENINIDFTKPKLEISCQLSNIIDIGDINNNDLFFVDNNLVYYSRSFEKDDVFPFDVSQLYQIINQVIDDIKSFEENYFKKILVDDI